MSQRESKQGALNTRVARPPSQHPIVFALPWWVPSSCPTLQTPARDLGCFSELLWVWSLNAPLLCTGPGATELSDALQSPALRAAFAAHAEEHEPSTSTEAERLKQCRYVLLLIDGTWCQAREMFSAIFASLPPQTKLISLPVDDDEQCQQVRAFLKVIARTH
jgi:hypothetical protein